MTKPEAIEAIRGIILGLDVLDHPTLEALSNAVWETGMGLHLERKRVEQAEEISRVLESRLEGADVRK